APLAVQGPRSADPYGKENLAWEWWLTPAPLSDTKETTAHTAPGYPWLVGWLAGMLDEPNRPTLKTAEILRWGQCALGALTAGLYFLFGRRAFRSSAVGTLTGLFCALHPFWVINALELNDGVLASFLLGLALVCGARASQEGDAFASLLYGLALAG